MPRPETRRNPSGGFKYHSAWSISFKCLRVPIQRPLQEVLFSKGGSISGRWGSALREVYAPLIYKSVSWRRVDEVYIITINKEIPFQGRSHFLEEGDLYVRVRRRGGGFWCVWGVGGVISQWVANKAPGRIPLHADRGVGGGAYFPMSPHVTKAPGGIPAHADRVPPPPRPLLCPAAAPFRETGLTCQSQRPWARGHLSPFPPYCHIQAVDEGSFFDSNRHYGRSSAALKRPRQFGGKEMAVGPRPFIALPTGVSWPLQGR